MFWVKNKFLGWKTKSLIFLVTTVTGFWAITVDALSAKTVDKSFICFGQEWGRQHVIRPINFRKRRRRRRRSPAGPFFVGQALGLAYQAHNTWPHFFFFFIFCFFLITNFLYVFIKIILAFMFWLIIIPYYCFGLCSLSDIAIIF